MARAAKAKRRRPQHIGYAMIVEKSSKHEAFPYKRLQKMGMVDGSWQEARLPPDAHSQFFYQRLSIPRLRKVHWGHSGVATRCFAFFLLSIADFSVCALLRADVMRLAIAVL